MGEGQLKMPDRLSLQLKLTTAEFAFTKPFASGTGVTDAVIVGGVLSRLTMALPLAVCPEASVTVPLIVWFAPSIVTTCDAGHCSGGTPPARRKETVTPELFQPAPFGGGAALAVTVSGVSCTLSVTLVEAVFPALSVAELLKIWPA